MTTQRRIALHTGLITAMVLMSIVTAATAAGKAIIEPSHLKLFTFDRTSSAAAMRAKDYHAVIRQGTSGFVAMGYHDLVNLCAAHAFEGHYARAARACSRAVAYRVRPFSRVPVSIHAERWVAYANRGVVRALGGDSDGARRDLAMALRKGGDPAGIAHNLAALDAAQPTFNLAASGLD